MPSLFKIGPYLVYFWSSEGNPMEPVHVHIAEGIQTPNSTKVWLTRSGRCIVCDNASRIPPHVLKRLLRAIEANSEAIVEQWRAFFDEEPRFIL